MTIRRHVVSALVAGAFAGVVAISSQASAAVMCSAMTFLQWKTTGSCQNVDKLYTYMDSHNIADGVGVSFTATGLDQHQQVLDFKDPTTGNGIVGPYTADYTYSVEVTDPMKYIRAVSIDSTGSYLLGTGQSTITKDLFSDNAMTNSLGSISSVDGAPDSVTGLNATFIVVKESFNIATDDLFNTVEDTFIQATRPIPEPATLGLFGLGLIGLGLAGRRRRKTH